MGNTAKGFVWFVAGTLFGSVGFKLLGSKDAKKAFTHVAAAGLRMKDSAMETVTKVQENFQDIMTDAAEMNEARAAAQTNEVIEDAQVAAAE